MPDSHMPPVGFLDEGLKICFHRARGRPWADNCDDRLRDSCFPYWWFTLAVGRHRHRNVDRRKEAESGISIKRYHGNEEMARGLSVPWSEGSVRTHSSDIAMMSYC